MPGMPTGPGKPRGPRGPSKPFLGSAELPGKPEQGKSEDAKYERGELNICFRQERMLYL